MEYYGHMKHYDLLSYWMQELKKYSKDIEFKIDVLFEDTINEEFYFFINPTNERIFYVFYDNWGYGIGINYKNKNRSSGYYLEELHINNQEEFLLSILIDVVIGTKIFVKIDEEYSIDFSKYTRKENLLGFNDFIRYSIDEINKLDKNIHKMSM
jgi:hypothetical protein